MTLCRSLVVSVRQKDLIKDVTICADIILCEYKNRHPDNTDEPQDMGLSSDDEATGLKEQIGITRRITLSRPSPGRPSTAPGTASPAGPSGSPTEPPAGFVKLGPDEVVISKGVLQGIKGGAKLALKGTLPAFFSSATASAGDLPFDVPQLPKHAVHCTLCRKDFSISKALRRHLRMHRGETNYICQKCGKHLPSSCMMDMHEASCGSKDFPHNCQACGKGYHTKQALVQHMKVHHPPASEKECTCLDCKVVFKLVKTMREHWATHRGPFPCPVEDCPSVFSLPKCCNRHLREKHGFDARRY